MKYQKNIKLKPV